ncbi:MAG: hypothetical protein ACUVWN_10605 [bacterium]
MISALAHKHSIPVTWVGDSQSLFAVKDLINQGHYECNDDILIIIDPLQVFDQGSTKPSSKAEEMVILRQRLPNLIQIEQIKVKESFAWTEANLFGAYEKNPVLVEVLESLDCIGLWGYRWRDYNLDETTDQGCPWSFFYASHDHHNIPSNYQGKLVAIEYSSVNLTSSYYSDNLEIFSAIPSVMKMSGLCSEDNMNYASAFLKEYLKNSEWNRFIIFVQQQPAIDMEYASYNNYDKGTIAGIAKILESFFQEVESNPNIKPLTISQAVKVYKENFGQTEACYMVFDDIIPFQIEIDFYLPSKTKQKHPYPLTFFYYDHECQLVFKEGQMIPIEVKNYVLPPYESKYYIEKEIPSVSSFRPMRERDKLIMEFEIESLKRMPYGLAIWDDHSMFSLVSTNARSVKWIGNYLLFIRFNLEEGMNLVEISLTI